MTLADEILAILQADSGAGGVAALCTGGIYNAPDISGHLGISRESTPDAYDANGLLQPMCVVRGRGEQPLPSSRRYGSKQIGASETVELWFYDDPDAAYTTIEAARERAYAILHDRPSGSIGFIQWAGDTINNGRAEELNDAAMLRSDYRCVTRK